MESLRSSCPDEASVLQLTLRSPGLALRALQAFVTEHDRPGLSPNCHEVLPSLDVAAQRGRPWPNSLLVKRMEGGAADRTRGDRPSDALLKPIPCIIFSTAVTGRFRWRRASSRGEPKPGAGIRLGPGGGL